MAPDLPHRALLDGPFWQRVPMYASVSEAEFLDHGFQARKSVRKPAELFAVLEGLVSRELLHDVERGFLRSPMSMRITPYILSLIDWTKPYEDPLRIQFIPLGSRLLPDHPCVRLDSLGEQADAVVPGLTHRYPDRALFLAVDTCPVYCRFCTRSYVVGHDTASVEKVKLPISSPQSPQTSRWKAAFDYVASRPELEDVLVSGGDMYQLRADQITEIGTALIGMKNVLRVRFATKGPAVMPQKILTDEAWTDALTRIVDLARARHKEVALHTHFNHPSEITQITERAMQKLHQRGVTVRNQSVLLRGVNDTPEVMTLLVKRLSSINVHPYYVYVHDLVTGVEDLRTSLATALFIEKRVRGETAGFNTPTFVVDTLGGGGKRDAHSFEHYDRTTGISVFEAPIVKPGVRLLHFDPLHALDPETQRCWNDEAKRTAMVNAALDAASSSRRS
jgi:lysine 2,3-aminomutase